MTNQINKKESAQSRISKIDSKVDSEVNNILSDLTILSSDLDALMEILKDRMIESTDASFPIALARLGELRIDTVKKRIDVLKMLVNDKGIEAAAKKRSPVNDLESILSGIGLGTALGVKVSNTLSNNNQPNLTEVNDSIIETIDVSNEEFIVETEYIGEPGPSVSDILRGK